MAEESDKEQLQQSGNNRTAHTLYASGCIYAATKVGVATKIKILVRPKPDQPDRLLRPCDIYSYNRAVNLWLVKRESSPLSAIFTTCHSGRGISNFSCYGNSILYNEIVEIGGYTIQFYHKQPSRSYCHKNIGIFVYNPMGGVQLLYTKWVTHSFSMVGCKYSNTYNFTLSTANHLIFRREAFPIWNFQHIKHCCHSK